MDKVVAFLGSKKFFWIIIGLFIFQTLWIALSSRYPMAFDEQQHFGVIQLRAETWSPFLGNVPDKASEFGAIARDPSFLYHYLMSFPYRIIAALTDNFMTQVIILRLMNIALVVFGMVLFRRLLGKLSLSDARTNIIMLFFTLIPIVPLMAANISYDNLIFLITPAVFLLATSFVQTAHKRGHIDVASLTLLLLLCLYASMVKYAFLPVFAAVVLGLTWEAARHWRVVVREYKAWWKKMHPTRKAGLLATAVVGVVLFLGSYGYNVVMYHAAIPRCDDVLTTEACSSYGPWVRDYEYAKVKKELSWAHAKPYVKNWFIQMMYETFFVVAGYYDATGRVLYEVVMPLPVLYKVGWALFVAGVAAGLLNIRAIMKHPVYRIIFAALLLYTLALFLTNIRGFVRTSVPVAIHGRYLIPLIIPVIGILSLYASRTIGDVLRRLKVRVPLGLRLGLMGATLLVFVQGGLVSFIVSSSDAWFWQESQAAIQVNRSARDFLTPFVWGSDERIERTEFMKEYDLSEP